MKFEFKISRSRKEVNKDSILGREQFCAGTVHVPERKVVSRGTGWRENEARRVNSSVWKLWCFKVLVILKLFKEANWTALGRIKAWRLQKVQLL